MMVKLNEEKLIEYLNSNINSIKIIILFSGLLFSLIFLFWISYPFISDLLIDFPYDIVDDKINQFEYIFLFFVLWICVIIGFGLKKITLLLLSITKLEKSYKRDFFYYWEHLVLQSLLTIFISTILTIFGLSFGNFYRYGLGDIRFISDYIENDLIIDRLQKTLLYSGCLALLLYVANRFVFNFVMSIENLKKK